MSSVFKEGKDRGHFLRFVCVSEASPAKSVEVLGHSENDPVTPFQLRQFVSMVRGEPVLYWDAADMAQSHRRQTRRSRLLHNGDLRLLGRYLEALAVGSTTTQFLNQEYGKNA